MKRYVFFTLIFSALFAATALADNDRSNEQKNRIRLNKWNKSGGIAGIVSNLKNRHDDDDDDDDDEERPNNPGQSGGNDPPANPEPPKMPGYVWVGDHWERERAPKVTTPQGKPGFVWVGDHWEREKAPTSPVIAPATGTIVIRDHRKPVNGVDASNAPGGVIVTQSPIIRDHRTQNGPIIRDHRESASGPVNAPGGVWVTETTGKPRPKGGGGGGLLGAIGDAASGVASGIGNAVGSAGDAIGDVVGGAASTVGRGANKVLNTAGEVTSTLGRVPRRVVKTATSTVNSGISTITPSGDKPNTTSASGWTVVRDHR
jgi:hypothetical protein